MSALFPTPLPGELLYSVIARFRDMLRFPDEKMVLEAVVGTRTGIAVVELTGRIEGLLARLPPGHRYTAADLLWGHTTLPYYQRFIPASRVNEAATRLRSTGSAGLTELLGIRASTVPTPTHLRFCRTCAAEDREEFGVPYWRRAHQLPGVLVCTSHGTPLWRSALRRTARAGRHIFRSVREAEAMPSFPEPLDSGQTPFLLQLAHDTAWLLNARSEPITLSALHHRYRVHLAAAGWIRSVKQIRMSELRQAVLAQYGRRGLQRLGCGLQSSTGEHDWLARLLRKPRAVQHPLHHLLVIRFLGLSAEEFFCAEIPAFVDRAPNTVSSPASACLNPLCRADKPLSDVVMPSGCGVFRCSRCGYTYRILQGESRRVQVLGFGRLWEEQLRKLVRDQSVSLRAAASLLGVTPKTVKRHARRLGVWRTAWRTEEKGRSGRRREAVKATAHRHRTIWQRHRTEFPSLGTSQLRQQIPATYSYLYRYDRDWLDANRPPRPSVQRSTRVDWTARDAEMRGHAEEVVSRILASPDRPIRLRVGTIARVMGHVSLIHQRLDRLPSTRAYLESVFETPTAFAVRRIRWAAEQLASEGRDPLPWALVRKAALRPCMAAELAGEIERTCDHFRRLFLRAA